MILHIPHASRLIPPDVRRALLLIDAELDLELTRMTDAWTDELFLPAAGDGDSAVVFPVSRLVVDPERFEDDALEPMAGIGMGAVYVSTSHGAPLRAALPERERQALLDRFYRPHHRALEEAVGRELARTGEALIVDCHSFPSSPLPYETDRNEHRPEICIGTDAFHTPARLRTAATLLFERPGFGVALDAPFSGSIVPQRWYRSDPAVRSIMIEVRRDLFTDERSGERLPRFGAFRVTLGRALGALASQWRNGTPGSRA
jgi:N-formylglutamate amidohydrolase